jgi:CheY-like chemotaxis protein
MMCNVDVDEQINHCINGKECLEHIKETYKLGEEYEIIIMDFSMPVMTGIECTKRIR